MAWPLTGSALTKYNRLLSDLRQYGDFIFVGAPDDITWLQETIVVASDGQLRPPLDDVANRSHYWMLRTIALLGNQTTMPKPEPCPECPPVIPCPPCPPLTGIDWGPDSTTLDVSGIGYLDLSSLVFGTGTTSIILRNLETVTNGYITADGSASLESFSAPELVSVSAYITASFNTVMTNISFPKFATGGFVVLDSLVLQSVSLPSFTGTDNFIGSNSPLLVNINVPVFLPTNGVLIEFLGCALSDTSVNHILARAVANAAYVSGTIDTSGGTSSAPTGQGILDKATLIGRGVTVNTN